MNKRQILVFTVSLFLIVVICRYFDNSSGDLDNLNISMYVWGLSPLVMTIIFRIFNNDWEGLGLKPYLSKHRKYYLLSLIGFPILLSVNILMAQLVGKLELTEYFSISEVVKTSIGLFGFMFLKNISEEFAWRGYLTYSFKKMGMHRLQNHLLVGLIWGIWHLPYIDTIIIPGANLWIWIPVWMLAILPLAIIYGELRLRTKTVWTVILFHTMGNILFIAINKDSMITNLSENIYLAGLGFENVLSFIAVSIFAWLIFNNKVSKIK